MAITQILQWIIPKDRKFLPMINKAAENVRDAATVLKDFIHEDDPERRLQLKKEIKRLEKENDRQTVLIFNELSTSFITPFDKEDIHNLASAIDDMLDSINSIANKLMLYKLQPLSENIIGITNLIEESSKYLIIGIEGLHNLKKPDMVERAMEMINEIENKADDLYHLELIDIFDNETNAIELIKKRDLIGALEKTTDKAEDISDILKSIVVKFA
jgi:uncharacterized protein